MGLNIMPTKNKVYLENTKLTKKIQQKKRKKGLVLCNIFWGCRELFVQLFFTEVQKSKAFKNI